MFWIANQLISALKMIEVLQDNFSSIIKEILYDEPK